MFNVDSVQEKGTRLMCVMSNVRKSILAAGRPWRALGRPDPAPPAVFEVSEHIQVITGIDTDMGWVLYASLTQTHPGGGGLMAPCLLPNPFRGETQSILHR